MKFSNLLTSVPLGSLMLMGCPGDDTGANETGDASTGPGATTTTGMDVSTGPGTTSSVDDTAGSSTGEPWPEFDCADADQVIEGNVLIESDADIAQLENVREVTRSIVIDSTTLTNLDALGCVQTVGENLQIFGNDALTNVDGLVSLTEVGGNVIFTENGGITDLDGFHALTKIDGSLSINKNDALTQVSGFHSLVGIEANITIRDNPVLLNIDGLKGLMVVNGVLAITANPSLCLSSVNCVGAGIVQPPVPPPDWSINANDPDC